MINHRRSISFFLLLFIMAFGSIQLSCTKYVSLPESNNMEIPFLSPLVMDSLNNDSVNYQPWHKGWINLSDQSISMEDQLYFLKNHSPIMNNISWDGAKRLFVFNPLNVDMVLTSQTNEDLEVIQSPNISPYFAFQGFGPTQSVAVYLTRIAERTNEIYVEIFGSKAQRLTLNPRIENSSMMHVLKPVGIAKKKDKFLFYLHVVETSSKRIQHGILQASYDGAEIQWKTIAKNISTLSSVHASYMIFFQDHIYFADHEGKIRSLNVNNGKIRLMDKINDQLSSFKEHISYSTLQEQSYMFYNYGPWLIIQWNLSLPEDASIILFIQNNKVKASLQFLNKSFAFNINHKVYPIEWNQRYALPGEWVFAQQSELP